MAGIFTSTALRLLLLAALVIIILAVAMTELLQDPNGELEVFLCNTNSTMKECRGLDDVETCADINDGGVDCVQSACGHQLATGFDISIYGADDPLDPASAGEKSATSGIMVFWGLVPYMLVFLLFVCFLFAGDTTSLSFVILLGLMAIVNEGIFKQIISQHRPEGSCLYFKSFGMPSGHSVTSIGMLWDMLLEIWVDRPKSSLGNKAILSSVAVFCLVMVPYSRVYLHDHWGAQVGAGAAVGFVLASLWFCFMYMVVRTRLDGWMNCCCCKLFGLRNTYRTDEPLLPPWARCGTAVPPQEPTTAPEEIEDKNDIEKGVVADSTEMEGDVQAVPE